MRRALHSHPSPPPLSPVWQGRVRRLLRASRHCARCKSHVRLASVRCVLQGAAGRIAPIVVRYSRCDRLCMKKGVYCSAHTGAAWRGRLGAARHPWAMCPSGVLPKPLAPVALLHSLGEHRQHVWAWRRQEQDVQAQEEDHQGQQDGRLAPHGQGDTWHLAEPAQRSEAARG